MKSMHGIEGEGASGESLAEVVIASAAYEETARTLWVALGPAEKRRMALSLSPVDLDDGVNGSGSGSGGGGVTTISSGPSSRGDDSTAATTTTSTTTATGAAAAAASSEERAAADGAIEEVDVGEAGGRPPTVPPAELGVLLAHPRWDVCGFKRGDPLNEFSLHGRLAARCLCFFFSR